MHMQYLGTMFCCTVFRTFRMGRTKLGFQTDYVLRFHRLMSSGSSMKAVIIEKHGGPEVLRLAEVPKPSPAKSEVLVKVFAAGVNPVDLFIREGAFMSLPKLPLILGKEVAGIVTQVGSEVKTIKEGDRVTCCLPFDGGYAEYAVCDEKYALPLSTELSFAQGSTLYVSYFVAYRALITKCKIKRGERLFVHGASGGVGISAIQIAKNMGLSIVGSARSKAGRDAALAAGAEIALDHSEKDYLVAAHATTNTKGFDIILENSADTNLGHDLMLLAPNGRIAVKTLSRIVAGRSGPVRLLSIQTMVNAQNGKESNPLLQILGPKRFWPCLVVGTKRDSKQKKEPSYSPCIVNPRSLMYTEGCIHGVKLIGVTPDEFVESVNFITSGVEAGWLRPHVGKEFQLGQAGEAHRRMVESPANGKIVLIMRSETGR